MTITSLAGLTTGKYIVTTASGTRHLIDLDEGVVIRKAVEGHEWHDPAGIGFGDVTPDGQPFHFLSIRNATVGESMRLDNSDEWRITSVIQSIRAVNDE